MTKKAIPGGVVHRLPTDFGKAITSDRMVKDVWMDITPLARNEWICWVTSAKQEKTRKRRIVVGLDKMRKGMRRPCCWEGCAHRSKLFLNIKFLKQLAKKGSCKATRLVEKSGMNYRNCIRNYYF